MINTFDGWSLNDFWNEIKARQSELKSLGIALNDAKIRKERAGVDLYRCENMNRGGRDYAQDNCDREIDELNTAESQYYEIKRDYEKLKSYLDMLFRERRTLEKIIEGTSSEREIRETTDRGILPDDVNDFITGKDKEDKKITIGGVEVNGKQLSLSGILGLVAIGFALAIPIGPPKK